MEASKDINESVKIEHYDTPKFKNILKRNMINNLINHSHLNIAEKDKEIKVKMPQSKVQCNIHNAKYMYKCQYSECKEPYICPNQECIEEHFHNNQIVMCRFDLTVFREKYNKMQECMNNHTNLVKSAMRVKNTIDGFKTSVITLSKDVNTMNVIISDLKSQVDQALNNDFLNKIDEALLMEQKITHAINVFKSQLNLNNTSPQSDFHMKHEIIQFLQANIANFHWNSVSTIFNSKKHTCDVRKFHQLLKNKKNLIFIFIASNFVICTYVSALYPGLGQKFKDNSSFIMVASHDKFKKITKYIANSDLEYHFAVEDSAYVNHGYSYEYGDGVFISKDDLLSLQYRLPSLSFQAENEVQNHQGCIRLDQIIIVESQTIIQ